MKTVCLTDVCEFQGGTQPPKNEWSNSLEVGFIRMLQIRDFTQSERTSPEYVKDKPQLKRCNSDDILIGRYGASIGKILTGLCGAYNVALVKTIPNPNVLTKEFLLYLLKGPDFQNFILGIGSRAAQAGFNQSDLSQFSFALPPLQDQIRIAHLLEKVEGLIAKRKEDLAKLDVFLKSVFLEMFGDPVRNEKGWELRPFSEIGKFQSGGTPSKERADFWDGYYPWVSPKDMKKTFLMDAEDHISEIVFKETSLKRVEPNHLLIVVRGMILAHTFPLAINLVPVSINQDMKAIRLIESLNIHYMLNCMHALKRQVMSLITTAGHGTKKFDAHSMGELLIPIPPLSLQNKFAAIVEKVESLKSQHLQSLTDLESLYGTLSQKAFAGELDLERVKV